MVRPALLFLSSLALPLAFSQTADIPSSLNALQQEWTAPAARGSINWTGIDSRLKNICANVAALPLCDKWGLELASKLTQDDDVKRKEAVVHVLGAIRQLNAQAAAPATEESAMVTFLHGWMLQDLGRLEPAAESLRDALGAFENVRGADDPRNAEPLAKLAEVYIQQADLARAEPLLLHGLELLKKSGPEGLPSAYLENNLAEIYEAKAEYAKAEQAHLHVLEVRRKLLPPDDPIVAASLNNLGELYEAMGEYDKARERLQQAVDMAEKAGVDSYQASCLLNNLAELEYSLGFYGEAERDYKQALALMEKARGAESADAATVLAGLAAIYNQEGAFALAEPQRQKVLKIMLAVHGTDHPATAIAYNNLGALYFQEGNYPKAVEAHGKALEIRRKILPPGHPDIAQSLDNLAHVYMNAGQDNDAEPLAREALGIREKIFGADSLECASSLANIGFVQFHRRDYATAEPLLRRVVEIREKNFPPGSPDIIYARIDYARDLWMLGRRGEARDQLISANRDVALFWSRTVTSMDDQRRRSFTKGFDDLLNLSLSFAADLAAADREGALNLASLAIGTRKGIRSSAGQEVFARIRSSRDPQALDLLRQLTRLAEQQAHASLQDDPKSAAQLRELRAAAAAKEQELIEKSGAYREWRTPVEPARITGSVPPGAALVDVIRYTRLDPATGNSTAALYAATVYVRGGEPQFVPLGAAAPIESAVQGLRSDFDNIWRHCAPEDKCAPGVTNILLSGSQFQANLARTEAHGATLYSFLMPKLQAATRGLKRLIISPDAALAEFPWEVLRSGIGRYLLEDGYRIRYIDSVRTIAYPPPHVEPKNPAVVIAGVDYDGKLPAPALKAAIDIPEWSSHEMPAGGDSPSWRPLQGAADVLRTLSELQQAGRIGPIKKLPLGSEDEVMALREPAAVIAYTHGFFRAGSSLGDGLDSGIVLYGANHAVQADPKGSDGILLAKEAMLMNLEGTRLVALFGCETGRGVEAGEGVQGFRHALAVAGARSTLLTLWEVGDLSAARFLRELLIRSTAAGSTILDSLAATRLAFLHGEIAEPGSSPESNRWRHPYFWAAATLAGQDAALDFTVHPAVPGGRR